MTEPLLLARRLGHAALGQVAPELAGRMAVRRFTSTRLPGARPADLLPLGARRFGVRAAPDIRGGYLWGEEGPTALLVHGWRSDSSAMQGLVVPLRARRYQVAAFDAPGHGVCAAKHATLAEITAATEAVARALGDVRVVVAHSFGAIAAVAAVARLGLDLESLVLLAPARSLAALLDRWAAAELRLRPRIVAQMHRELSRRGGHPVSYWDTAGLAGQLGCPVLVMHDPEDDVVPCSDAEAIAAGLPDVRLEPAPGRGHLGILMSQAVTERVAAFVAEHATRTPGAVR